MIASDGCKPKRFPELPSTMEPGVGFEGGSCEPKRFPELAATMAPWSEVDANELRAAWALGATVRHIAHALGKTNSQVCWRARVLGLSTRTERGRLTNGRLSIPAGMAPSRVMLACSGLQQRSGVGSAVGPQKKVAPAEGLPGPNT